MPYDCKNSQHKLDGECPCTVPGTCDFTEKPFWELKTGEFFDGVVRIKAGDIFIKKLEPVVYDTIFKDIQSERERQNSLHPSIPKYLLHPVTDPARGQFHLSMKIQQEINDASEKTGEHSWYGIMNEEEAEVFSAETIEDLYTELIQSIALRVRLIEAIQSGLVKLDSKQ